MKRLFTLLIAILLATSSVSPVIALDEIPTQSAASPQATTAYQLQDSTVVGDWNPLYKRYNCYAYALGRNDKPYLPGGFSGNTYNESQSVTVLALHTKEDLQTSELGYACVRLTSERPTTTAANETCICIRKGPSDFHYMRLKNGSWYHKPGGTQPLKYKGVPSTDRVWTNEYKDDKGMHLPNTYYDSEIVYILYKQSHGTLTYTWTEEHYHSGSMHYYRYGHKCADCNDFADTTWISMPCTTGSCLTPWSLGHEAA